MLRITIPATEQFNEVTNEFITTKEQTLTLEHSLISISKWESKWCKPFFSKEAKTPEETIDYIKLHEISAELRYEWSKAEKDDAYLECQSGSLLLFDPEKHRGYKCVYRCTYDRYRVQRYGG